RVRLQHEHSHRLGDPVDHVRNTEDPGSTFLGYLHRPNRTREIATGRHAIPQCEEVVLHILFVLLDRDTVGPGRPAVALHLQPRTPLNFFGDFMLFAWPLRLNHAFPPFPVDHPHKPGRPRPFVPRPTAIRGRISTTTGESASVSRDGTQSLTDSAARD